MIDLGLFYLERKYRLQNLKKKSKSDIKSRMCNILELEAQEQLVDSIESWRKDEEKQKQKKKEDDSWYT